MAKSGLESQLREKPIIGSSTVPQVHSNREKGCGTAIVKLVLVGALGLGAVKGCFFAKTLVDKEIAEKEARDKVRRVQEAESREFTNKAAYILPEIGLKGKTYTLDNGSVAVVSRGNSGFYSSLDIELDGSTRFRASNYHDLKLLNNLELKNGDKWEEFELRDRTGWQERYEDLVERIYQERKSFEDGYQNKVRDKLTPQTP